MRAYFLPLVVAAAFLPPIAAADLFITDFTALNGTVGAVGTWQNVDTHADTGVAVTLTQTGGVVRPADGSSRQSVIDGTFPWQDIPAFPPFVPAPIDAFNPNYDGDFINIEVKGAASSVVTIAFGGEVIDPVLNFTDIDTQTVIQFQKPFTVTGGTANLSVSGMAVGSNGQDVGVPFRRQSAGSLRFAGTHTQLVFTIVNSGPDPDVHDDRIGFSVSTTTAPGGGAGNPPPKLEIATNATHVMVSWQPGSLVDLEFKTTLDSGPWASVPGVDVRSTSQWSAPRANFGSRLFVRGVYQP
jgi:hypothetical protein